MTQTNESPAKPGRFTLLTNNPLPEQMDTAASGDSAADANAGDSTTFSESDPATFPAPAKKLHQLINEEDFQPTIDTAELDQKVQALDKQLASINEQLKAQGMNVPAIERPQPSAL